jgi:endogenous inhibitor of DNA gyrase (YacG/DUF329 family)
LPGVTRPCPICGKPSAAEFDPFCSRRCQQVDLNRWLSGTYVIPGRPEDEGDTAEDERKDHS